MVFVLGAVGCSCGDDDSGGANGRNGHGDGGGLDGSSDGAGKNEGGSNGYTAPQYAELWYSVDDLLVHIQLDAADGSFVGTHVSHVATATGNLPVGQNAITMRQDGGLVGARLSQADMKTYFYYIAEPPRDGSDVTATDLGVMPGDIMLEGLYTDCDGRLYGMDTGENNSSAVGNRLLRFTGNYLAGDFAFVVVSDLATADVANIDDMSPGISNNEITDNPGLAIDTGAVYRFNYERGSGTPAGNGGTFGIHALGADLFTDKKARLYVLTSGAGLHEMNPTTFMVSPTIGTGPTPDHGMAGWSGLAGPLTDCESGFTLL
ncbi:MAG: hypothetical protein KC417_09410 [Myxococcales bacterium]|nr:hypothetical protein [Myxococcales bacterium]